MPIAPMHMGEGPSNPVKRKATHNPWILVNILTVVIINEVVLKRLAKNDQNDCRKNKADNDGSKTLKAGTRRKLCGAAVFQRFLSPRSIFHLSTTRKQKAGEEKRN